MEETRADESLPWFKQRERQPHNQLRLFVQPSVVSDLRHHLELQDGGDIDLNPDIAVVNLNVFRK